MTAEFMTKILGIPVLDRYDEPTVRDIDLGVRLGMEQPLNIRRTIRRHIKELQSYGVLHTVQVPSTLPAGSTGETTEYHLTEPQLLCLCQLSPAPQAATVRRMLITAFPNARRGSGDRPPAGMEDVIAGPCSFPYLVPGNTRFDWQGHSISTDISRLDKSRDVVALLPDGAIDIVRLVGPPYGAGGRQGITRRYLNPDIEEATPVMVIILGQITRKSGRRLH